MVNQRDRKVFLWCRLTELMLKCEVMDEEDFALMVEMTSDYFLNDNPIFEYYLGTLFYY